jgi:hypothetical protein
MMYNQMAQKFTYVSIDKVYSLGCSHMDPQVITLSQY